MILENEKSKYLHILAELEKENAKLYTQKELALYLDVSLRKVNSFVNGEIFD